MKPNREYIYGLLRERGWSGSELARRMGVSRAEANRILAGTHDGGKKCIGGLIRAFPGEPVDKLFVMK